MKTVGTIAGDTCSAAGAAGLIATQGEAPEQGYVLVKGNEREHPAHSKELVKRIDALARYLGHGNYEPTARDLRKLKRARRLWTRGYSNFREMLKQPEWWRTNARKQYPIIFPPDAAPLPASVVPDPVYVNGGSVLPYQPLRL